MAALAKEIRAAVDHEDFDLGGYGEVCVRSFSSRVIAPSSHMLAACAIAQGLLACALGVSRFPCGASTPLVPSTP